MERSDTSPTSCMLKHICSTITNNGIGQSGFRKLGFEYWNVRVIPGVGFAGVPRAPYKIDSDVENEKAKYDKFRYKF